ncbi:extracellular solute-binding protein [Arhodomonas aquaeolei]|uniref:ABC transporter substrate-binding protein n=1 Tax=Arhodomonas aquaeolei TaxID=2369 RepID=UPI002168D67F|nr:extracellular solute-binding protein [Arhodomonas aquaeolei]MCS4505401.1 extracellular solute-binding protein [Arhodomonas aquaeolei]
MSKKRPSSFPLVRALVLGAAGLALVAGASFRASAADDVLRVLTWEGLANDQWVKPFEEAHDVKVKRTYVGSNDEYMAKLAAGDTQYDVVVIVSSLAQPAIDAGFVEPVDLDRIPNFGQLYPRFQELGFLRHDGRQYGVPNDWDVLPVTVNADEVDGCSFDVLFDDSYSGRISMWDDVATLGTVAAYMGYDNIWTLSDEQLEKVKQKMIEQKPLVRTYWSTGGQITQLFASGEVVATLSWSYVTEQLKDQGVNVVQCTPERTTAFLDSNFVVSGTEHRDLAHAFINYLISPKVMAQVYESSGFGVTNPKAGEYLPAEAFARSIMARDESFRRNINFWREIPRRGKYLEVWNEIKAANVD